MTYGRECMSLAKSLSLTIHDLVVVRIAVARDEGHRKGELKRQIIQSCD